MHLGLNQQKCLRVIKMLVCKNLKKIFVEGNESICILDDINFNISKGETVSIIGSSGSGKTTLLGLCAGLDQPSKGTVELCGFKLSSLNEDELARLRNEKVGFIFQNFQLLPTLVLKDNRSGLVG